MVAFAEKVVALLELSQLSIRLINYEMALLALSSLIFNLNALVLLLSSSLTKEDITFEVGLTLLSFFFH